MLKDPPYGTPQVGKIYPLAMPYITLLNLLTYHWISKLFHI